MIKRAHALLQCAPVPVPAPCRVPVPDTRPALERHTADAEEALARAYLSDALLEGVADRLRASLADVQAESRPCPVPGGGNGPEAARRRHTDPVPRGAPFIVQGSAPPALGTTPAHAPGRSRRAL
jgi:hypothetical protein